MNKEIDKGRRGFAGYKEVEVVDEKMAVTFPMVVMYPTSTLENEERFGPYRFQLAKEAKRKDGMFPLVLISHGTGGTPYVYRTLARDLARKGFIVGMPEHPFNNLNDNTFDGTVKNLSSRPRHLSMALDWFFTNKDFDGCVNPEAVAVIGHSMGGYTALAAAGGVPTSFPHESPDNQTHSIFVEHDPRINALVLLAPASVWFRKAGALNAVNVPILMCVAEDDAFTPSFHAAIILDGVPDRNKVTHKLMENAGHFSFLIPFPENMKNKSFLPSQDPPGFDRESFQDKLSSDIIDFLYKNIK